MKVDYAKIPLVFNVYKPPGPSSFQVVYHFKKNLSYDFGKIAQGCGIRLLRNGKIMHDGKLSSLKRFKDDAKEVKNGYECGISLEGYSDIKQGDIFEAYMMVQKKRTLDDNAGMTQSGSKESRPML